MRQRGRARIRIHGRSVSNNQQCGIRFAFHAYNFTTKNTGGTGKGNSKFSP
jgi:hypothetical protein